MKTMLLILIVAVLTATSALCIHETIAANQQRLLATVYQNNFEALARTMHGQVRSEYVCKLRPGTITAAPSSN